MFATAKELVDACKAGRVYGNYPNEKVAQEFIDKELQRALDNNQGCKDNRPWHIVDFAQKLDKKLPWIGFEFETGFNSKDEYQQFIRWLWDQPYVAIDREGTGEYPVEVAFPPQTLKDMEDNDHLLMRCVKWVEDNKLTPARNPTTFTKRDVGIHAGISTAKWRAMDDARNDRYNACNKLDRLLDSLNDEQRNAAYGRTALHWGCAHNRHSYVELKMFRAIPSSEYIAQVVVVTKQCVKMLDALLDDFNVLDKWDNTDVFNFLTNPDADIELEKK